MAGLPAGHCRVVGNLLFVWLECGLFETLGMSGLKNNPSVPIVLPRHCSFIRFSPPLYRSTELMKCIEEN